jgi:uncharacterized protein (UPF0335 family)
MKDGDAHPDRDFGKMLDLNRSSLTKNMVTRMEECMRAADIARDDLKEVVAECVQAEFGPLDIAAMKKIARLRLRDQQNTAKDQLRSLQKIAEAVDFNLFDWAETQLRPAAE